MATKIKKPSKHDQRRQVKQELEAVNRLGLKLVLRSTERLVTPPKANIKMSKDVFSSLWTEGEEVCKKKGVTLGLVNVTFEPSPKVMHRWEIEHRGVVPFSSYPEFELVVQFVDTDNNYHDMPATAVYESLVHRFSHHNLWVKGVPKTFSILDFMVIKDRFGVWAPAFGCDLFYGKQAIEEFDL